MTAVGRDDRPVAAVFRSPVFQLSEGFIQTQAASLVRYQPLIIGLEAKGNLSPALQDRVLILGSARQQLGLKLFGSLGRLPEPLARAAPVLVHAHFATDGLTALPIAQALGVPLVTSLRGYDVAVPPGRMAASGRLSWMRYALLGRRLRHQGGLFLAVSEALRAIALERGFPADRTLTHYDGVRLDAFTPAPGAPRAPVILHVARLVEKKGTALLIRAFAEVRRRRPDAELVIIGTGPLEAGLRRLAAELELGEAVRFLGSRPHAQVMAWMRQAWVLAAPSIRAANGDAEGLPTVVVEAIASGVPVVGSIHSGIPEAVVDGVNGFLAPERDVDRLAERLALLLGSAELRAKMGAAARALAEDRFELGPPGRAARSPLRPSDRRPCRTACREPVVRRGDGADGGRMRLTYVLGWSRLKREAGQEQTVATAAALARAGAEVTLLMPQGPRDPPVSIEDLREYHRVDGDIRIERRPFAWPDTGLVPSFAWLRRAAGHLRTIGSDLNLTRIPAALGAGLGGGRPFVFEHYRPWPDHYPLLRGLFRRTLADGRCAGAVLHSAFAAESYRRLGIADEKLLVAHNGFDPDLLHPVLTRAEARGRLGLPPDRPIAVYAGRLNGKKGLDQVLLLADRRPEVLFLLVGSEGEGAIERAARSRPNVEPAPWQAPDALPAYLYAADVLLIPASAEPMRRFGQTVLPLKTFTYLAAGRPILAPASADTAEILLDGVNALLVPPGQPDAASDALGRLLSESDLADLLGRGARATAETRTWDHRARRLLDFFDRRLAASGVPAAQ